MNINLSNILKKWTSFICENLGLFYAGIQIKDDVIVYFEAWRTLSGFRVTNFIEEKHLHTKGIDWTLAKIFEKKTGLIPASVNVIVQSKGVIARIIRIPKVPKKEIAASIYWEINKHIPFEQKTVEIDYQVLGHDEESGQQFWRILFVEVKKKSIESDIKSIRKTGLKVRSINYLPVSSLNAFKPEMSKQTIARVSMIDDTVCINILKANRLISINSRFQKTKKARNKYVIEFLKGFNEEADMPVNKVFLDCEFEDLSSEINKKIGINVVKSVINFTVAKTLKIPDSCELIFSVFRKSPVSINLLSDSLKKENKKSRVLAVSYIIAAAIFAFMFIFYFNLKGRSDALKKAALQSEIGKKAGRVESLITRLREIEKIEKEIKKMDNSIKLLSSIKNRGSNWNKVMAGIAKIFRGRYLYGKLWLQRIKCYKTGKGYIEGVSFSSGYVTILLKSLEEFKLLSKIEIFYIKPIKINKIKCVKFRIRFRKLR